MLLIPVSLQCYEPQSIVRQAFWWTYPSFIPLLSNYQTKGGPECVNGCLFKNKVKEDSPLALFASKGKTGEILDKEHIRDFFNRNIWLRCCLSGCSSSTWEVSVTIFKLFTGFPITRWLLVHFLLSLVLLCPRMPKQRCREERPGRRKIKSKNTGAGVRRPSFLFSLHRKAEQTVLVPWTSHTLHSAKPLSMPGKPCFSLKSRLR